MPAINKRVSRPPMVENPPVRLRRPALGRTAIAALCLAGAAEPPVNPTTQPSPHKHDEILCSKKKPCTPVRIPDRTILKLDSLIETPEYLYAKEDYERLYQSYRTSDGKIVIRAYFVSKFGYVNHFYHSKVTKNVYFVPFDIEDAYLIPPLHSDCSYTYALFDQNLLNILPFYCNNR